MAGCDVRQPSADGALCWLQGTGSYGRWLDWYYGGSGTLPNGKVYGDGTQHPITAFGGHNIIYEVHNYDSQMFWQRLFAAPAATLPVIIGELGPEANDSGDQVESDSVLLMGTAESMQIPYAGWIFDEVCNDNKALNMISLGVDNGAYNDYDCDHDVPVTATEPWGVAVMSQLQSPPQAADGR